MYEIWGPFHSEECLNGAFDKMYVRIESKVKQIKTDTEKRNQEKIKSGEYKNDVPNYDSLLSVNIGEFYSQYTTYSSYLCNINTPGVSDDKTKIEIFKCGIYQGKLFEKEIDIIKSKLENN